TAYMLILDVDFLFSEQPPSASPDEAILKAEESMSDTHVSDAIKRCAYGQLVPRPFAIPPGSNATPNFQITTTTKENKPDLLLYGLGRTSTLHAVPLDMML